MATLSYSESINTEREKANLLCLIKLTLNTLIDQSSSPTAAPVFDDRNADCTNFILTLERILSFRMRATWLSDRRFFWDFIRPACIGSCRQTIIERVEEVSNTRDLKEKGRIWIKLALMEKKLSELLKLVISDCYLVRKFYYEDSIILSSQAYILSDQLAGLNALDFSFCFKHDGPIIAPLLLNDSGIDVIDLTPFLGYKSKHLKSISTDSNKNEENKEPTANLSAENEMKPLNSAVAETVSLERYKLEVEQRKYFEELLRHRDREFQQLKARYETLKGERESEIVQMESIILELQLELRTARDEAEFKRKKIPQSLSTSPSKNPLDFDDQNANSPRTPTNDRSDSIYTENNSQKQSNDFVFTPSESSRRSSHSTTTTNTDDDQYELARQLPSNISNEINSEINRVSSPEMISSADEDEQQVQTPTMINPDENQVKA